MYMHCCGHNLSHVSLSASELPVIKIILDLVKEVTQMYIKDSKK